MPPRPDRDHKTPIPKVIDVATFHSRFAADPAYLGACPVGS